MPSASHQPEESDHIAHRPERAAAEILVHDIRRLDGALAGVEILACYSKHGIFSHTAKVAKVLVRSAGTPLQSQEPRI